MSVLLGGRDAAERLGVTRQMVSLYVAAGGDFPAPVDVGGVQKWRAEDLDRWRAKHPKGSGLREPRPERGERAWAAGLDRLHAYVAAEGHALVPEGAVTPSGFRLDTWVRTQRDAWKRGVLSPERIAALDALPGWMWTPPKGRAATALRSALAAPARQVVQ